MIGLLSILLTVSSLFSIYWWYRYDEKRSECEIREEYIEWLSSQILDQFELQRKQDEIDQRLSIMELSKQLFDGKNIEITFSDN